MQDFDIFSTKFCHVEDAESHINGYADPERTFGLAVLPPIHQGTCQIGVQGGGKKSRIEYQGHQHPCRRRRCTATTDDPKAVFDGVEPVDHRDYGQKYGECEADKQHPTLQSVGNGCAKFVGESFQATIAEMIGIDEPFAGFGPSHAVD